MKIRLLSFLTLVALLFSMTSCDLFAKKDNNEEPKAETPTINVYTLNGTTGFGMAKLMNDAKAGTTTEKYNFSVQSDASMVTSALLNGSADIAALPTNAAANIYNKSEGGVVVLAVNTLGCLYLLTNQNETITSFEDLRGKTVYVPAQNPTFIFTYLCKQNGLEVGKDITINSSTYAQPAALKDAVASGLVDIAVLPEPMVTIAINTAKSAGNGTVITNAMDLTAEWNKVAKEGSLVQGCIVVRRAFLEQYPEAVENFLKEYKASIEFLSTDLDGAAQMIVDNGIFTSAPVAKKALPNCNVCFLDGAAMKAAMETYLGILHGIAPASIGGKLPADNFYYVK
ncbi:MAG: ABC transporter substrate-binding protein [Ruminococcaceae bacterium]|nr:ABC transporter substrate-binding protein [Oscillospiraceae bacterium]